LKRTLEIPHRKEEVLRAGPTALRADKNVCFEFFHHFSLSCLYLLLRRARRSGFDIESVRKKDYTDGMANQRNTKTVKTTAGKKDPVRAAEKFGIDISAIKDNLRRSPAERIRHHQIKLNAMIKSGQPIRKPSNKQMILELEAIKELMKGEK
jgi:hypothetical protein